MKNVIKLTVLFVAVSVFALSCGGAKHAKTIENLKAAITGETNASATYQAFSVKAAEEGYPNIAKMFAAASAAEAIHVKNHNAVLEKLGKEAFNPTPDRPTVNATADNIQAAVEGETYEFTVMYPDFIAVANTEQCTDAIPSFTWASDAEATHAMLYAQTLQILKTTESDETVASVWYTCPKCGDLFNTIEGVNRCPLCGTNPSAFLKF
jgi:rubrerythrin